jgi:hypothetical protein
MISKIIHWIFGCKRGKIIGKGKGIFIKGDKRGELITRDEYRFQKCKVCGSMFPVKFPNGFML